MATISSTIELYDRVSAPVNKIIGALNNMVGIFESVDSAMDSGFNPSKMNEVRTQIDLAAREMTELGEEIRQNEEKQKGFNKTVDEGASSMDGLANKVMGMVATYASFQGVKKLVDMSDEYVQTTARLNMINDGLQTSEELQNKIFASAQRSRASYTATADAVAKLSLNAKDAFGSNDETILFAENLNKLFAIAGTEQASVTSATLQLTQAMGSGVLRGEEFNAVFEAAPNIMQTVADYMGVPIGSLRTMAAEGQLTADVVKNALLGATDNINSQFESMPMTWGQVWTGVMNKLYLATQPVLEMISWLAQNWSVLQPIVIGLAAAIGIYTGALLVYNAVKGISALVENVHAASQMMATGATFAATAAQHGFNAALMACPLTWILLIIIAVIAAIYAIVAAINKVTGKTISATGIIVGALMAAVAFIWNLFLGLLDLVLGIINHFWNYFAAFANFFANLFTDPIGSIIHLFGDMADLVLGIIETIAKALDKVFGSNLAGTVQGWRSGLDSMVEKAANKYGNGSYEKVVDEINLSSESLGLKRWAYSDAYNTGYDWGANLGSSVSDAFDTNGMTEDIATTAENTGEVADSLEITNEDLKYLKDLAERDVINRFTTAEIKVDMTNNNNIGNNMDLDGIVEYLVVGVNEAMATAAEGVHV